MGGEDTPDTLDTERAVCRGSVDPVLDDERVCRIRAAVERLQILDSPREQAYDDLVQLTAQVTRSPIAAIGVFDGDRIWFKARTDSVLRGEIPVLRSMLAAQALQQEVTVVLPDLRADPRTRDNPLVVGPMQLRSFMAVPIRTPDGITIGSVAVADHSPRAFSAEQVSWLETVGRQVEQLFALRQTLNERSAEHAEALRGEARFRKVLEAVGNGVIVYDNQGRIEDVNPAAVAIMGSDRVQLVGNTVLEFPAVHEDGTPFRAEERPVAITLKYGIEVRDVVVGFDFRADRRTWLLVNSVPLRDPVTGTSGAVVTFADVTDLMTLKNQLQESLGELAKAAQERVALMSSVSHDLRAPLAAIRMMTEVLDDRADAITDTQRAELIRRIRAEARRTEGVLTDLVSANRLATGLEAPRRKRVDLAQLIYARAREFDGADHSIRPGELSGDLTVWADAAQLERILDNLISNAVTHTPAGTRVVIEAREVDGRVELAVDDDGPGVPDSIRERIFSPYVRGEHSGDRPGSGLGLYLVQQFAQFHGGSARCLTSERGGARFVVTVPRRANRLGGAAPGA